MAQWAGGHYIGVACQYEYRPVWVAATAQCPQVGDEKILRAEYQGVAFKAQGLEPTGNQFLATCVIRRGRGAAEQLLGQVKGGRGHNKGCKERRSIAAHIERDFGEGGVVFLLFFFGRDA